ncbi:hypothetical protein [Microtetraspora niveoalba]|uniref:hypothetical protein n=1 Tax=Microtetraspora niveoalba TaxID=46175 RepID=UPI000832DDB5|nr:hypothetical protein [Microtetraspora niveoalba]
MGLRVIAGWVPISTWWSVMFLGMTPREAHTVGESVAVAWSGAAIAADGTPVNWSDINIDDLDQDGPIREAGAYFNRAIFQAQLEK